MSQDWQHLPIPRDRAVLNQIVQLGEILALVLDPVADAIKVLKEILGPAQRTLGVVNSRQAEMVREGDLIVTVPYYGSAQGGWRERTPRAGEPMEPAWGDSTGDLWLNEDVYLEHVPERVWQYELGGYPVIKKWLGYRDDRRRPGRGLTMDELDHLRGIVQRIAAVLLLHDQLDAAYEKAVADPLTAEELGLG